MNKKKTEILFDLAETNDGYVSVAEARENGIAQTYLSLAEEAGFFLKVSKGLYIKKGYERDSFYELSFRYKKAVFSLESALYLHGLADRETLTVNLPLNYMTNGIEGIACRHVGRKDYSLGQSYVVTPNGNLVLSYDLERTLIDLLRNQESFSKEELMAYWEKGMKKRPYQEKLDHYAEQFQLTGVFRLIKKLL